MKDCYTFGNIKDYYKKDQFDISFDSKIADRSAVWQL